MASAFALRPRVILLDESTSGVRAAGRSILIAESNVHHVPEGVDRVAVIERGAIVSSGTLAVALAEPQVANVIASAA